MSNSFVKLLFAAILSATSVTAPTTQLLAVAAPDTAVVTETAAPTTAEPDTFTAASALTATNFPSIYTPPATTTTTKRAAANPCAKDYAMITLDSNRNHPLCIFLSYDTASDSGSKVAMYMDSSRKIGNLDSGSTFLYAHNYANIFGKLKDASTFTITYAGQTRSYQIVSRQTYCYHECNGKTINYGWMSDVVNPKKFGATISLMTCSGPAWGPGDAKDRFVAYARPL
jgi:hypothetical protein